MWSATPRVGAEMVTNVSASERTPRIVIALAAGLAGAFAPSLLLKALLAGTAVAVLTTVATGYCPINAALDEGNAEAPHWRTLKTHRVEA
jgi:hypothetical protein